MFKCECGHVFDSDEFGKYEEVHGEIFYCCPMCHSTNVEEAIECARCGELFTLDEVQEGLCGICKDELISEYIFNPLKCYNLSKAKNDRQPIKINGLLTSIFTEEQIEEILLKQLEAFKDLIVVDCKSYIYQDLSWFLENAKEVGQNDTCRTD